MMYDDDQKEKRKPALTAAREICEADLTKST